MNETIQLLNNHRSIRKFTNQAVPEEKFTEIIAAAQHASTSSNMQAYSIIHISDSEIKQELSKLAGNQAYVADCAIFLVWCADLLRLQTAFSLHGDPKEAYINNTDNMIAATVDAALAGQNAAIAAESLGLGVVYIGGIRNQIDQVSQLLQLPQHVYPVFGMCIGYPLEEPIQRPRLPMEAIVHHNIYSSAKYKETIEDFDHTMQDYMFKRTAGKRSSTWSEDMFNKLKQPNRMHMKSFLEGKGFSRE